MIYLKLEWDNVLISVGLQKIFGDKWKKLKLISFVQPIDNNCTYFDVDDDYNSPLSSTIDTKKII